MSETTQQYIGRITGYVQGQDHLAVLGTTPKKVRRLTKDMSVKKLAIKQASDKWSIAEILAHLAESEIVFSYRLRLVLGANGTPIQAFDQNAWQANAGYIINDPKAALNLFRALRKSNTALLKSVPAEQWDRFGMHQERGKETVSRMVEMFAGHDVNHLQQIEQLIGKKRTT